MSECPDCQVPKNAVILNELRIIEFLDPADGEIYKLDVSCAGDGSELLSSKYLELCEWARMIATAPILADLVSQFLYGDDEDGGEEEIFEVTV